MWDNSKIQIDNFGKNHEFFPDVLRLDLLHPQYGGNKYFKLKQNVSGGADGPLITFGGAHSNHIYATAAFCAEKGVKSIGIIRGENMISSTLDFARQKGMTLIFVNRAEYVLKEKGDVVQKLLKEYPEAHVVPEGGANEQGIRGSMEIQSDRIQRYDYIFCACGTATTFTGLLAAAQPHQTVIGISVLKGENQLLSDVNKWSEYFAFSPLQPAEDKGVLKHSTILSGYHFGGYAKHTHDLLAFKQRIETQDNLPLDYLYTLKLLYAIFDLKEKRRISEGKTCLMIHSGGVQGNEDYEKRYNLTLNR
jgi:1-aminocyclopropane-1-carboxylate deaminase